MNLFFLYLLINVFNDVIGKGLGAVFGQMLAVKGEVLRMFLLHVAPVKHGDVTVVTYHGINVVIGQVTLVHRGLDDVDLASLA